MKLKVSNNHEVSFDKRLPNVISYKGKLYVATLESIEELSKLQAKGTEFTAIDVFCEPYHP